MKSKVYKTITMQFLIDCIKEIVYYRKLFKTNTMKGKSIKE